MNGDMDGVTNFDGEQATAVSVLLSEDSISPGIETSSPSTPSSDYLVQIQSQTPSMAQNFAIEHRIFLRAILDLLTKRDQLAEEPDFNSPNTLKTGFLKKPSHRIKGMWKTKYVEIRRGTFSYFDENDKQRHNTRKDISLKATLCTCQVVKLLSVKILPGNSGGAVFELQIKGGPRRLWMATSKQERQSWIEAIHSAMIGTSKTRGDNFFEHQINGQIHNGSSQKNKSNVPLNSPYKSDLDQYVNVREAMLRAESKDEYLRAISRLRGKIIQVPVQWTKSQLDGELAERLFLETEISSSVEQLWKDLLRDSVEINGIVLGGDSFHGPDRIIGKLTQRILSSDALLRENCKVDLKQGRITESQAISFARDILLASDRTRSGGDSFFCAQYLCLNEDLVVLTPSSTEANPISIRVSPCQQQDLDANSINGWVSARVSSDQLWKRQYLVLRRGVLSCYAEGKPKPHDLVEHITLHGANVGKLEKAEETTVLPPNGSDTHTMYTVNITTKDGRLVREFLFRDGYDSLLWHASLLKSAGSSGESDEINSIKSPSGIQDPSTLGFVDTSPAVDAVVNVCTDYKLCTLDPTGIEGEDTWAEVRTTFVQKLSLTGGPDGRISRGEEVVRLEMLCQSHSENSTWV